MNSSNPRNNRIKIIADDLTSAADGACPFLYTGHAPRIYCQPICDENAHVISIDTNSRNLTEAEAFDITFATVQSLSQQSILYKTIDSTLRGHIRAEILAAFQASKRARMVVAPAFPAAGRTTLNGIQLLHGQAVSTTSYGLDPVHPAHTSSIAELIDSTLGAPLVIPANQDAATYLNAHAHSHAIILDANDQNTLNHQVLSIATLNEPCLWVGSPGMAQALAQAYPAARSNNDFEPLTPANKVLIVVGSANAVSHAQCEVLDQNGVQIVEHAHDIHNDAPIICLRAPNVRHLNAAQILQNLVHETQAALSQYSFDALIATGGETMAAVLKNLAITRFTLTAEVEPGFPVGVTTQSDGASLVIAMKAGGFGTPQTLLKAAQHLLNPFNRLTKESP